MLFVFSSYCNYSAWIIRSSILIIRRVFCFLSLLCLCVSSYFACFVLLRLPLRAFVIFLMFCLLSSSSSSALFDFIILLDLFSLSFRALFSLFCLRSSSSAGFVVIMRLLSCFNCLSYCSSIYISSACVFLLLLELLLFFFFAFFFLWLVSSFSACCLLFFFSFFCLRCSSLHYSLAMRQSYGF